MIIFGDTPIQGKDRELHEGIDVANVNDQPSGDYSSHDDDLDGDSSDEDDGDDAISWSNLPGDDEDDDLSGEAEVQAFTLREEHPLQSPPSSARKVKVGAAALALAEQTFSRLMAAPDKEDVPAPVPDQPVMAPGDHDPVVCVRPLLFGVTGADSGISTYIPQAGYAANSSVRAVDVSKPTLFVPTSDPLEAMRVVTGERNIQSAFIESEKRLTRNQRRQRDEEVLRTFSDVLAHSPILPLTNSVEPNARLPIERLPKPAQQFVRSLGKGDMGREQMACAGLLGAVFVAAQGDCKIREGNGYAQLMNSFIGVSSLSASGKSDVMGALLEPILALQSTWQDNFANPNQRVDAALKLTGVKIAQKNAEHEVDKAYRRSGDMGDALNHGRSHVAQAVSLEDSIRLDAFRPKFLLDRVTMTQLAFKLAEQGGAAAIMDDEGSFLRQIRPGNDEILLKGFTGQAYSSATRNNGCVSIRFPGLAICIFTQPSRLRVLFDNEDLLDHGIVTRFLPVFTSSRPDAFDYDSVMPPALTKWYGDTITMMLKRHRRTPGKDEGPRFMFELSSEANELLRSFRQRIRTRGSAKGTPEPVRLFLNRLDGHAKSLAGAIHLLAHANAGNKVIDAWAMQGGIEYAEFFLQHAVVALDRSARDAVEYAWRVIEKIKAHEWWDRFSARQMLRAIGSSYHHGAQLDAGLRVLEHHNFIRRHTTVSNSLICVVNPQLSRWLPSSVA